MGSFLQKLHRDGGNTLVKKASATSRPTVTVQFAVGIFDGELVVVGELLSAVNLPQGEDYDVLLAVHVDDSRVAVRITGVVDESRCVAVHGGVHHVKIVNAEHVTADALAVVVFFPFVCENRANDVTSILDHHLSGLNVPLAEKTTTMNIGSVNSYSFFRGFLQVSEPHRHW